MKRTFILLVLLTATYFSEAQTKLTIMYKTGNIKGSSEDYRKPNSTIRWSGKYMIDEFTISDSVTFYETVETLEEKDEFSIKSFKRGRKTKILGKAFVPNTVYCDYAKGYTIKEVEWKDDNYFVRDSIINKQDSWILSEEAKTVFGYPCKLAYTMEDDKISRMVWYTDNFKCSLSATGDYSLPGTVLESLDTKSNTLTTAIDLQIATNPMMIPVKGAKLVSQQEFDKIKKNKKG
jgi:GLPGLI family protein